MDFCNGRALVGLCSMAERGEATQITLLCPPVWREISGGVSSFAPELRTIWAGFSLLLGFLMAGFSLLLGFLMAGFSLLLGFLMARFVMGYAVILRSWLGFLMTLCLPIKIFDSLSSFVF
jgi:hypothetical protein